MPLKTFICSETYIHFPIKMHVAVRWLQLKLKFINSFTMFGRSERLQRYNFMKMLHTSATSLIGKPVNLLWKKVHVDKSSQIRFLSIATVRYILLKIRIVWSLVDLIICNYPAVVSLWPLWQRHLLCGSGSTVYLPKHRFNVLLMKPLLEPN